MIASNIPSIFSLLFEQSPQTDKPQDEELKQTIKRLVEDIVDNLLSIGFVFDIERFNFSKLLITNYKSERNISYDKWVKATGNLQGMELSGKLNVGVYAKSTPDSPVTITFLAVSFQGINQQQQKEKIHLELFEKDKETYTPEEASEAIATIPKLFSTQIQKYMGNEIVLDADDFYEKYNKHMSTTRVSASVTPISVNTIKKNMPFIRNSQSIKHELGRKILMKNISVNGRQFYVTLYTYFSVAPNQYNLYVTYSAVEANKTPNDAIREGGSFVLAADTIPELVSKTPEILQNVRIAVGGRLS
jgi:hypothetical protein